MGLTRFPNGVFATPTIGASLGYGWKTNSTTYFVDGTNGSDGFTGKSPNKAFATIQKAIDIADRYDVIYIFDKLGSSYNGVTGKYTEILTIDKNKNNLSLIGASEIRGFPIRECGIYGVTGSPVLTIGAGSVTVENLKFGFNTGVTYGIYAESGENTTNYGHNPVIYNCRIAGFTANAGIKCIGLQGAQIYRCEFMNNLVSIYLISATVTGTEYMVDGNYFGCDAAATTLISADVQVDQQGTGSIAVTNNIFAHLLPAGAIGRWISISDTRQGIIAGNQFGGVQNTAYTIGSGGTGCTCPNNVGIGQNYSNGALMARA
jgi:hypothetical protein